MIWLPPCCGIATTFLLTAIPTLAVLCAMRAASLDEVAWVRCVRRVIVAISAFAVFAVLTNNVHHFIFAFDFPPTPIGVATIATLLATTCSWPGISCCS